MRFVGEFANVKVVSGKGSSENREEDLGAIVGRVQKRRRKAGQPSQGAFGVIEMAHQFGAAGSRGSHMVQEYGRKVESRVQSWERSHVRG